MALSQRQINKNLVKAADNYMGMAHAKLSELQLNCDLEHYPHIYEGAEAVKESLVLSAETLDLIQANI